MTVIAYDGIVVATDTRITNDSGMVGRCNKLYTHGTKALAVSGAADHGEAMVAWFKSGSKSADFPHPPGGDVKNAYLYVFEYMKPVLCFQLHPVPVVFPMGEFCAGCGGDIARAVMLSGGDAIKAVEVACKLNIYCGGPVTYVDLQALADDGGVEVKTHIGA